MYNNISSWRIYDTDDEGNFFINDDTGQKVYYEYGTYPTGYQGPKTIEEPIEYEEQNTGDWTNLFNDALRVFDEIGADNATLQSILDYGLGFFGIPQAATEKVSEVLVGGIKSIISLFEKSDKDIIEWHMPIILRCNSQITLRNGNKLNKEGLLLTVAKYYKIKNNTNTKESNALKKALSENGYNVFNMPYGAKIIQAVSAPAFVLFPSFEYYKPFYDEKDNLSFKYVYANGLDYFFRFLMGRRLDERSDKFYGEKNFGIASIFAYRCGAPSEKKPVKQNWIDTMSAFSPDLKQSITYWDNTDIYPLLTMPLPHWDKADPRRSIIGYITNFTADQDNKINQLWPYANRNTAPGLICTNALNIPTMWSFDVPKKYDVKVHTCPTIDMGFSSKASIEENIKNIKDSIMPFQLELNTGINMGDYSNMLNNIDAKSSIIPIALGLLALKSIMKK